MCLFFLLAAPGKYSRFSSVDTNFVGYVGQPLDLPTNFEFTEGSGQCNCWRPPLQVFLQTSDRVSRYHCFVDGDRNSPTMCPSSETFTVSPASTLSGRDIINFSLRFNSLTLNDTGSYVYSVEFNQQVFARMNFVVNVSGKVHFQVSCSVCAQYTHTHTCIHTPSRTRADTRKYVSCYIHVFIQWNVCLIVITCVYYFRSHTFSYNYDDSIIGACDE